jgi:pimeloyl-ACP methyl ester carboxylesterase
MDVVFVHGLGDNDVDAWQAKRNPDSFWPLWLATAFPEIQVWMLRYGAPKFWFGGDAMSLPERATSVLAYLADNGIGQHDLLFIAHSLGGLIVKQLLSTATSNVDARFTPIAMKTRGMVFLATPHTGCDIAFVATRLGISSKVTAGIQTDDAWLRSLSDWYRNNARRYRWETRAFYETRSMGPSLVVNKTSADPHVEGVQAIPVDANHIDICKPVSIAAPVYKSVERLVEECLSAARLNPQRPTQQTISVASTSPESVETTSLQVLVKMLSSGSSKQWAEYLRTSPVFFDRYRGETLLGFGATATVIGANDTVLRRPVALKLFDPATEWRSDFALDFFKQEARVLASVRHPHICQVYDFGAITIPWIAMEWIPSPTLIECLREASFRLSTFDFRTALKLAIDLTSAVDVLHRAGLIQLDLKPGNILVSKDWNLKIIDLGSSYERLPLRYRLTQTARAGTPEYLAPEIIGEDPTVIDAPSDIFSLGAIFCELGLVGNPLLLFDMREKLLKALDLNVNRHLAGTRWFSTEDTSLLREIHAHYVNTIETFDVQVLFNKTSIPDGYASLTSRMLRVDPGERPSAESVLTQLLKIQATLLT